MKKLLLSAALALTTLAASAQISDYNHPATIMGQEQLSTPSGQPITLTTEALIIHDVDDSRINPHTLKVLKGKNYKVKGGTITPDKGFNGTLTVNVQVNDGEFDSNIYPLKIAVGEAKTPTNAIYVSPNGNDNNNGTEQSPIKSLARARELVKSSKASVVYFREGEYYMDRVVTFTAEDSGSEATPILYMAYPNESVRFTGSVALPYDQFKKAKPEQVEQIENTYIKAKIKVIDLAKMGITDYGEIGHVGYGVRKQPIPAARLFIDCAAQNLARYPNVGNFADVNDPKEKSIFRSKSGIIHKWRESGDIWIDGSIAKAWEWQRNKIASIDADSTVTLCWDYHSEIQKHDVKMFYFNILEELDFPEEYFIDREKGLLYVFFPSTVSEKSDIRLTQSREPFIDFSGASYITFSGITFDGTRETAITTSKPSSFNTIDNCTIHSCGGSGVRINGEGNRVSNTHIHNIGEGGVQLSGGDYKELKHACNIVENCEIHDYSQERRVYTAGIMLSGVGQIARHLKLYNGPHMSIRISGVNHVVEYSDLYNAPCEYSDMLGVYLCTGGNFFDRGTIIRRNKFHDVSGTWKQSAGVYMDNETNGVVVEENYFYDNGAQENGWSVMVHGGADNVVRRNVFVDCSYPFAISTRLNGYARSWTERILKSWEAQAQKVMNEGWLRAYPELRHYFYDGDKPSEEMKYNIELDEKGLVSNYWNIRTPTSNMFYDNLVYNSDPAIFIIPVTKADKNYYNRGYYSVSNFRVKDGEMVECLQHSNNHNVDSDPGFVNYKEHNLEIKDNSEILQQLPHLNENYFERIGLKHNLR